MDPQHQQCLNPKQRFQKCTRIFTNPFLIHFISKSSVFTDNVYVQRLKYTKMAETEKDSVDTRRTKLNIQTKLNSCRCISILTDGRSNSGEEKCESLMSDAIHLTNREQERLSV